jgi:phosphoglycerate dehydrogenase-like enzyme
VSTLSVLYTDPPWAVDRGAARSDRATVERTVLGPGWEIRLGPHRDGRYDTSATALAGPARGCAVLVVYRCPATPELLDAAGPGLRAVVRQGVGVDNLNAALLAGRGLPAYNVPDYCVDEVAAHTAALALALERQLLPQHRTLTGGTFDIYAGGVPRRLNRRTLGVVGFGRIGRAVARRLATFYGEVLVHDPYVGPDLPEGYGARAVGTLPELLARSDLVTLHTPLTPETEHLLDGPALAALRPGAFLVNAARGRLVDPVALGRALHDGRLAGAALDVFAPENPHDDPAWKPVLDHPAVVVTCHRAFLSVEAEESSRRRVAELVRDLDTGRPAPVGRVLPGGAAS